MYYDTPRDFIGVVYEQLLYDDQPLGWESHLAAQRRFGARPVRRSAATSTTGSAFQNRWVGVGGKSATT